MATKDVQQRFRNAWVLAGRLPATKQLAWREVLKTTRRRALLAKSGVGDDSGEWEWDLAIANELDRIYTAVSDEVKKTAVTAQHVAREAGKTAADVGFGLWPMALALGLAGWAVATARGTR